MKSITNFCKISSSTIKGLLFFSFIFIALFSEAKKPTNFYPENKSNSAISIYIECTETLYEKTSSLLLDKVKSSLSDMGCTFTDKVENANYKLVITATGIKKGDAGASILNCRVDVSIVLTDLTSKSDIFKDTFFKESGSTSYERAGKEVMEDAASNIIKGISPYLQK